MAKDLNLDYARIIKASVMHTNENGRRFESYGAMLSLRSSLRADVIRGINPVVAGENNRLSFENVGGVPVPKVILQARPQRPKGTNSTTRQGKAALVAAAATEAGVLTDTVVFDIHNEYAEKFTQVNLMKLEPAAEAYLNSVNKGPAINNKGNAIWQGFAEVGERFVEKVDDAMFVPTNLQCLSNLIAGIGLNMHDGSTALSIPNIVLFDAQDRPKPALTHWLRGVHRAHALKQKLIVVGGKLLTEWVDAQNMSTVQDLGYNADKVLAMMPAEFYYDSTIDDVYGEGKIIVSDAGAAALEFVSEHQDVIKANKVATTTYTTISMSAMGYDTDLTTFNMDLRVIESDDNAYPEIVVAPSLRSGIWTRPAGWIKTYGDWANYTGIFGAKLVKYADEI